MVAFPSDDGQYPGEIDASGRFTLSYAAMSKMVDVQNAAMGGKAAPVAAGETGFYAFLSESEWIDFEDMDNFSSCRQPAVAR